MKALIIPLIFILTACAQTGAHQKPNSVVVKPDAVTPKTVTKPRISTPGPEGMVVFGVEQEILNAIPLDDPLAQTSVDLSCLTMPQENLVGGADAEHVIKQLSAQISSKWVKPGNINQRFQCNVSLGLNSEGCIAKVKVSGCEENKRLVRSIETAIYRAAPYPKLDTAKLDGKLVFQFLAGP